MHHLLHLLAVLSLATALVAPTRRQTTRLRAASLEKKGDDYIFEDIAKNLGKGDQDRLYQYQLELAERYGEDKIGRAAPPPKPKKPKQGGTVVVEAVTTTPRTKAVVAPRNSKLRWRGLVCGAAVALFLTPGFLEYLISVRTKALALEKSLEALVVAVVAPATDALSAACGAAAPVCSDLAAGVASTATSAYGSVAAAASGAYGAAAPACAKACASVGAAASSASSSACAAAGTLAAKVGSACGSACGSVSAAASSAYSSLSATKVGAAVTSGVAKASARVGPPLARVWRFLVNWKGLIFWRPGS